MIEIAPSESASCFAAVATASRPLMSESALVADARADFIPFAVPAFASFGGAMPMIASAIFWITSDPALAESRTCVTAEVTSSAYCAASESILSCSVSGRSRQISTCAPGREKASSQET